MCMDSSTLVQYPYLNSGRINFKGLFFATAQNNLREISLYMKGGADFWKKSCSICADFVSGLDQDLENY